MLHTRQTVYRHIEMSTLNVDIPLVPLCYYISVQFVSYIQAHTYPVTVLSENMRFLNQSRLLSGRFK